MARVVAFRCGVIAELHRQLEWASREARLRLLGAAELLVREIEFDRAYPVEFVSFRLTAWKSEPSTVMETLAGEALLADLVTMIQRVSRRAPLDVPDGVSPLMLDDVAAKLAVSRRTLVRLRRFGLAMRFARFADGQLRLTCEPDTLSWFREHRGGLINRPVSGTVAPAERTLPADVVALAVGAQPQPSLQATVEAISEQCAGRSVAAVRSVLRRAVARGDLVVPPVMRLGPREEAFAERAMRRGVSAGLIAQRLGVGVPSMHRATQRLRGSRMRHIDEALHPPADDVPEGETLLEIEELRSGLPLWDARLSLGDAEANQPAAADLAAMHILRRRIRRQVGSLPRQPSAAAIDQIETDFRWMTQLRWRLVLSLAIDMRLAVEHRVGRDPLSLPAGVQRLVVQRSATLIGDLLCKHAIGEFERLSARTRSAIDRMLAGERTLDPSHASARLPQQPVVALADMEEWPALLPDPRWAAWCTELSASDAALVRRRWGLDGLQPGTIASVAQAYGCSRQALARRWASAQQKLLQVGKGRGVRASTRPN